MGSKPRPACFFGDVASGALNDCSVAVLKLAVALRFLSHEGLNNSRSEPGSSIAGRFVSSFCFNQLLPSSGNNACLVQLAVQYPAVPLMVSGVVISTPECCNSWEIANNWRMKSRDRISSITEHTKSEGVFTTAQAARLDILRDALSDVAGSNSEFDCARLQEMLVG